MGLMFYPRGGSAQVARYLSLALVECGWEVVLASGSLGSPGQQTHAATFFEGLHVEVADYPPALERFGRGDRRQQIHAVVGGGRFAALQLLADIAELQDGAPAAGPGIARARAIGVNDDRGRRAHAISPECATP